MRPCLNQDTLRTSTVETVLRTAKKTGFDAVELIMDRVEQIQNEHELSGLQAQIDSEGLRIASINGPENFNLLSENDFERILKRTQLLASTARDLDCNLLLPVPATISGHMNRTALIEKTAESLGRLADACSDDINLGFEFLGMRNCSVNNLRDAVTIVERVGRSNVGLTLDTFHLYLSETDLSDMMKLDRNQIFIVHVNDCEPGSVNRMTDANRVFPGQGVIDLLRFSSSLREIEYDGDVSLELLRPSYWKQDPGEIAKIGIESLRRFFDV